MNGWKTYFCIDIAIESYYTHCYYWAMLKYSLKSYLGGLTVSLMVVLSSWF